MSGLKQAVRRSSRAMFNPRLTWPLPDVDLPHFGASKDSQQREKSNDARGLTTMLLRRHAGAAKSARLQKTARIGLATRMRVTQKCAALGRISQAATLARARTASIGSPVAAQKS